jgi:hypothetical protein
MWYQPGEANVFTAQAAQPASIGELTQGEIIAVQQDTFDKDLSVIETYYSAWSNPVSAPCLEPKTQVTVEVSFTNLEIDKADDSDDNTTWLEVYGYFRVIAPAMGREVQDNLNPLGDHSYMVGHKRYLNLARWGVLDEPCVNLGDEFGLPISYEIVIGHYMERFRENGCPHIYRDGFYSLGERYFCSSTAKKRCRIGETDTDTWFEFGNTTIPVLVEDGDALVLEFKLVDYDEASDDDLVCEDSMVVGSRTLEQWAATSSESFSISSPITDSGDCEVSGFLHAAP